MRSAVALNVPLLPDVLDTCMGSRDSGCSATPHIGAVHRARKADPYTHLADGTFIGPLLLTPSQARGTEGVPDWTAEGDDSVQEAAAYRAATIHESASQDQHASKLSGEAALCCRGCRGNTIIRPG